MHLWRTQKMTNLWPLSNPSIHKNEQTIDLFLKKTKESVDMWQILRPPPHVYIPLPCGRNKCMVPYVLAVIQIFFSVLEKITILLYEQNKPIIKILLKHISKPWNCGSSVKVNGISDGIFWNFIWQNATNVYYTK